MLKFFGFINSLIVIGLVFLQVPRESLGLSSFATKTDLLGSASSAQRFVTILTAFGILVYFGIAIQLNLSTN